MGIPRWTLYEVDPSKTPGDDLNLTPHTFFELLGLYLHFPSSISLVLIISRRSVASLLLLDYSVLENSSLNHDSDDDENENVFIFQLLRLEVWTPQSS